MYKISNDELLPLSNLRPLPRILVWSVAACAIVTLGLLRNATDAEYAFASLALIPILLAAWFCERNSGLLLAVVAAVTWFIADITSERVFSSAWIPLVNALTRGATYAFLVFVITWLKVLLSQINNLAAHDQLTGLFNRRAFNDFGNEEVERSKRYHRSLAIVYIDLDNFKQLNDSQGHEVGDQALNATAETLSKILRDSDVTCRLGGDEFAVILPEVTFEAASEAGKKILSAIHAAMQDFHPVSASIGVAWFESPTRSFQLMLGEADTLMYEVKKQNKCGILIRSFM